MGLAMVDNTHKPAILYAYCDSKRLDMNSDIVILLLLVVALVGLVLRDIDAD
jgi:hypothetical protein